MSDVTAFKRDHYYKALREYGLPHHLAETIVDEFGHACEAMVVSAQINEQLRAENARLKADLAAIKGRTCATCKHVDHWTTSEDIDRYACAHNPRSTVAVTGEHFCGYHENKEAADAGS